MITLDLLKLESPIFGMGFRSLLYRSVSLIDVLILIVTAELDLVGAFCTENPTVDVVGMTLVTLASGLWGFIPSPVVKSVYLDVSGN